MTISHSKTGLARTLLATGTLLATITLGMLPTQAQDNLRVGRVGNDFTFFAVDYGMSKGVFEKHGVNLEVSNISAAQITQTLLTNNIDVGLVGGNIMQHVAKGVPIRAIGEMTGAPWGFLLVARNDDSVNSLADLVGKNISISSLGSTTHWLASVAATSQGLAVDDMGYVPVGGDNERVAALMTGAADAALVDLQTALALEASGDGKVVASYGEIFPDFINQAIYATEIAIENRPEDLRNFLAAWYETIALMTENKDEVIVMFADLNGLDRSVAQAVYEGLLEKGYFSADGKFNVEAVRLLHERFVEVENIDPNFPLENYYTEEFLP